MPRPRTFDRIVQFDERSRNYGVGPLLGVTKKITSKTWRCDTYLDQGYEGSCVGHACAHELAAEPIVVPASRQTALDIYYGAQRIDEWPGGAYDGAQPFYEGTSILAGMKMLKSMEKIDEYRWAFGLNDLVQTVSFLGPAILGINWYQGMINTNTRGFVRPKGRIVGGHAILCLGVNTRTRTFILHNSWGRHWGFGGRCFITYTDMNRLLREDGEACLPLIRNP